MCPMVVALSPSLLAFPQPSALSPLQLKLLLPLVVAGQCTMSSQRRQFLPAPSTSVRGSPPSQHAMAPTSTRMGHLISELGPAGRKRRALGTALPVTWCGAILPNQKHVGHLHYASLGAPGVLSKGIAPLLGQDAEGPIPAGIRWLLPKPDGKVPQESGLRTTIPIHRTLVALSQKGCPILSPPSRMTGSKQV